MPRGTPVASVHHPAIPRRRPSTTLCVLPSLVTRLSSTVAMSTQRGLGHGADDGPIRARLCASTAPKDPQLGRGLTLEKYALDMTGHAPNMVSRIPLGIERHGLTSRGDESIDRASSTAPTRQAAARMSLHVGSTKKSQVGSRSHREDRAAAMKHGRGRLSMPRERRGRCVTWCASAARKVPSWVAVSP
jgi:hypothetical protein